ncbi:unnamed protein product, partial [marine sediment metagenome]
TKLGRMIELRGSGKTPKNESIADNSTDSANYDALWGGWILTKDRELPWPIECFDGVTRTKEEYAKWMKSLHAPGDWLNIIPKKAQPNLDPDLDLVSASEQHENFWMEMTKKYASTKDEPDSDIEKTRQEIDEIAIAAIRLRKPASQEQSDLDLEAAKETTGFAPMSEAPSGYTFRELREMGWDIDGKVKVYDSP